MLNYLLKNSKFKELIDEFYKKNESEILDLIIFGSLVKGKEKPKDVDLLLIFKNKRNSELAYELRKKIESLGINIDVTDKTYNEIFESGFFAKEGVLSEGYSLVGNGFLFDLYGYASFSFFKYSQKNLKKSERVRFHYALMGRKIKGEFSSGILRELNGIKLADTAVLVPIENSEKFVDFLKSWRFDYSQFPILVPSRMQEFVKKYK